MGAAPRILLIDDDKPMLALVKQLAKEEFPNAQVKTVAEANELARALEAGRFDLVVTDYQLKWTNGLAVLRAVKSRYPDCPMIMFTATGSEEIAVEAMKAGLDDYVLKSPQHVGLLMTTVRSVLEQAEQRRKLKETEGRYHSLVNDVLDTSAVGLFILDASFRVVWINSALERYFGLRRADVLGQDKRRLIQERIKHLFDDPEGFAEKILQTYEQNDHGARFECHVLAGEGREERWLEHRSLPIRAGLYAGGRIEHYYDITERKRVQEALRETNDRLTALVQASPLAIVILDADGHVKLWNLAAERMFGWTQEEVLDRPLPTVPPNRQNEHRALRARVLSNDSFTGMEVMRRKKDGTLINVSLSTAPLRDTTGNITGIMGLMADITQHKQIERQASRMERMAALGQLLGGIAHELKNPLFILGGHVQLLQDKLAHQEFEALPADLQKVEAAADRMIQITERFLALAKPYQPRQEQCAVGAILQQTLDFLANELMKNQITVKTSLAADLPAILSDPMQLQEVFLNLMLNALQAMVAAHGKGTLTVSAALVTDAEIRRQGDAASAVSPTHPVLASEVERHGDGTTKSDTEKGRRSETEITASPLRPLSASPLEGNWIEVKIQDDGPGIAPEHQSKLFEPFFTTKPPEQGTGLGLWIVRNTVTALKGTVACGTEMGRGATFIVRLPVSAEVEKG